MATEPENKRITRTVECVYGVVIASMKIILLVVRRAYFWKAEYLKKQNRKVVRAMSKLSKYEQETIINFNVAESDAVVLTRDKAFIRKLDSLVNEFPEVYKCIGKTDIDKTYSMPKQYVSYRKPRRISKEIKQQRREMMEVINDSRK